MSSALGALGKSFSCLSNSRFHPENPGRELHGIAAFLVFKSRGAFLSMMALQEELNEQHPLGSERHRQAR